MGNPNSKITDEPIEEIAAIIRHGTFVDHMTRGIAICQEMQCRTL
jgi:hypothetical protein